MTIEERTDLLKLYGKPIFQDSGEPIIPLDKFAFRRGIIETKWFELDFFEENNEVDIWINRDIVNSDGNVIWSRNEKALTVPLEDPNGIQECHQFIRILLDKIKLQ